MMRAIRRFSAVASLLAVVIMVSNAAPARASDPLTQCRSGAWGFSSGPYDLRGSSAMGYGYPDLVQRGDVYRIDGTGSIKIGEWPWDPSYGAAGMGWGNLADSSYPLPGAPRYSLIGTFNANGQKGYLGPGGCLRYDGSSPTFLWLQMNDPYRIDNSGSWRLVIHQFR